MIYSKLEKIAKDYAKDLGIKKQIYNECIYTEDIEAAFLEGVKKTIQLIESEDASYLSYLVLVDEISELERFED